MTRGPPPLVLTADDDPPDRVAHASKVLEGVARVRALPPPGPERDAALDEAVAILAFAWKIPTEDIVKLRRLRMIQSVWAGVERMPVRSVTETLDDVLVASGRGPNAPQVAEHAIGLYLDCAKRITWRDRAMRSGRWPQETPGLRIAGSKVLVVGYGAIGLRVARTLRALDAEVIACTRTGEPIDDTRAVALENVHSVLPEIQGAVLCLPLTKRTHGVVDESWLQAMRDDGILVNIARGRLVDEDALHAHLMDNPSFQYGSDVWWHYPRGDDVVRQGHPFEELDNVVMTPHAAFHVPGTREEMLEAAARNVRRLLSGTAPRHLVDASEYAR